MRTEEVSASISPARAGEGRWWVTVLKLDVSLNIVEGSWVSAPFKWTSGRQARVTVGYPQTSSRACPDGCKLVDSHPFQTNRVNARL